MYIHIKGSLGIVGRKRQSQLYVQHVCFYVLQYTSTPHYTITTYCTGTIPQSTQSDGPVQFLIFGSISIFPAGQPSGRQKTPVYCWCRLAGNVLHHTYPLEYQICSSQPRQKSCWASSLRIQPFGTIPYCSNYCTVRTDQALSHELMEKFLPTVHFLTQLCEFSVQSINIRFGRKEESPGEIVFLPHWCIKG